MTMQLKILMTYINDARTWKSICLKSNAPREIVQPLMCCFQQQNKIRGQVGALTRSVTKRVTKADKDIVMERIQKLVVVILTRTALRQTDVNVLKMNVQVCLIKPF